MKIDYYKTVKYNTFNEMLYAMYNTYNETIALKFFNKSLVVWKIVLTFAAKF